ncbi:MAG: glycosyltransferase [Prevotella sp.]|nr:glycosyltransferase [Prevotella sp.]
MRVLHFIPYVPEDASMAAFLDKVLTFMGEECEIHLAMLTPEHQLIRIEEPSPTDVDQMEANLNSANADHEDAVPTTEPSMMQKYHVHCIGTGNPMYGKNRPVNLLALQKRYLELLYSLMPQIVHVHGSYHFFNSRIALWSRKRGFPVVFSPYGGMNPNYIEAEYGLRTWKMICYQKAMTRGASAILTSDPKESEYIQRERLTDRVELVSDPRTEEYWGEENYANSTLVLYQKVLDSDKGLHIDQKSREALGALLHLSLCGSTERQPLCSEDILNLRSITPKQWHDIHLFATEQGVFSNMEEGIAKAQLTIPEFHKEGHPTFELRHPKESKPLGTTLLTPNPMLRRMQVNKLRDCDEPIRNACVMLLNLRHLLRQDTASLRHLCDLTAVFRFDTMDEERLAYHLKDLRLYQFTRRICQILGETTYLDEGYMPVPALDDRGTAAIRAHLMKY